MTPGTDNSDQAAPTLSVVMPAFNAAAFIDEAIDSVLGQTHADLELIIVDDASTDDTLDIIERRALDDDRIRILRNETNLGPGGSTNRGIEVAAGHLIGRMDADDISLPERFEIQVATLRENPHYAVVGTFASHINEEGVILSLSKTGPVSEAEFDRLRGADEPTMVFGGTALFTRELFDKVGGFDPRLRAAVELDLFDRMSDHGPIIAVPEPLLHYRLHANSIVATRFYEGRQIHRFVWARRASQNSGKQPMTLDQFIAWENQRPVWRMVFVRLDDSAQLHYREAGLAFGRNDRMGLLWNLTRAFLANPRWVLHRLWTQRFSPEARASSHLSS